MNLIGINGFKRSGKNEVGRIIAEKREGVLTFGFADKLKIAGMRALGFDRPDDDLIALADSMKEGAGISILYDEPNNPSKYDQDNAVLHFLEGRQFLQFLGTEGARKTFSDTFWVDLVLPHPFMEEGWLYEKKSQAVALRYPDYNYVVVTDVRFDNEAERIKSLGGHVWEVVRPGIEGGEHASEQPLSPFLVEREIRNDGALDDLAIQVELALVAAGC